MTTDLALMKIIKIFPASVGPLIAVATLLEKAQDGELSLNVKKENKIYK